MFVSNPSTLAHICQSIRDNLVSVLLLSCFVKVRYLSYDFKSTLCPKSNPIHTIFTNCAPFPLHFHSISISIWIATPLKGSSSKLQHSSNVFLLFVHWIDIKLYIIWITMNQGLMWCAQFFKFPKFCIFYYCINIIIFISKVWPSFWRNFSYTKI